MKYLLLSLLSFSAMAQDKTQLESAFKVLSNPAEAILETCSQQTPPPEPAWCTNLGAAICAIPKANNTLATVTAQLDVQFFQPLLHLTDAKTKKKRRATANERANAKIRAIAEAERLIPTRTGVTQADMQTLFNETITSMKATLQTTSFDTPTKGLMTAALNNTKLMTGVQYIADLVADLKASQPGITDAVAKTTALTTYEGICSFDGMSPNAFNDAGKVVFCPGFIQSLADHGSAKDKLLTAISATMGHEIGHSIDANVFPTAYTAFGACQTANTTVPSYNWGVMQGEISADFWGVDVYAKRVAAEGFTGQDALDNLAVTTDDYCTIGGDATHPHAMNRLEEYYGRQSQMRTNLSCTTAPSKPACGL